MSIDCSEFLSCAEKILTFNDEISHRSAISRSYYAIYHAAELVAKAKNMEDASDIPTSHKRLAGRFERNGFKRQSDMLKALHKKRVRADYYINENINGREAVSYLNECKHFYKQLQSLYG